VPERGAIARKPATMSFPEAAVTPYGAIMAVALLDRVGLAPGHRMLVIGASGSLGSAAVQIAKARGAHVTGIGSGRRENYVRALGADAVLDYARDDFRGLGETWDVIFDVLGKSSFRACRSVLKPDGQYLRASFKTPQLIEMLWSALVGGKRAVCYLAPGGAEDLERVRTLAEDGLLRSIVDREFPLAEAAAAHQYVEEGRAEGKVALSIPPA
jgi:NADPH:quinone reductase-like Zn-dependent oxidoreductase